MSLGISEGRDTNWGQKYEQKLSRKSELKCPPVRGKLMYKSPDLESLEFTHTDRRPVCQETSKAEGRVGKGDPDHAALRIQLYSKLLLEYNQKRKKS